MMIDKNKRNLRAHEEVKGQKMIIKDLKGQKKIKCSIGPLQKISQVSRSL